MCLAYNWSVVPANNLEQTTVATNSQKALTIKPQGDMRDSDLCSRDKIKPAETDVSIRPGWFYHETEDTKVKTARELNEIYFYSVRRKGVLLLNIPPDKRGLINENDVKYLKEWAAIRKTIFQTNLLQQATVEKKLVDNNDATDIDMGAKQNIVEFEFATEKTFNILALQENIRKGQRIEKFVLEYWDNNEWKKPQKVQR